MKHKISNVTILLALLLVSVTLAIPVQAVASQNPEIEILTTLSSLNAQQRDEVEKIFDDRLERSATVSDRIQNTVNENFGLLFALAGLMISALTAIPIFSGVVIFIFRRTILEGIEKTITKELLKTGMQEILEDEVKRQLSDQVEEELSSKIEQKLTELEQQAHTDLSVFKKQLDQLLREVDHEKKEYVERLTALDPNIIREAAAKAAAEKFAELIKRTPLALIPGRQKR